MEENNPSFQVNIEAGVINKVYLPYLELSRRTQIFYGGAGSGKSVFLAQRAVIDVLKGGRNYLICRAVGLSVRKSVWAEVEKVINAFGVRELFSINKSAGTMTCTNGYQLIFTGLDDPEKLKSITPKLGVITDIWIEEATEVEKSAVKLLYKRQRGGDPRIQKRLIMSFNPILKTHWIFTEYFKRLKWTDAQTKWIGDDLSVLKTTYKDNAYLTPEDINDLENETDKYYRDVYTLGNWGTMGAVIFQNWRIADLSSILAQFVNPHNGLDFGFASHPAALHRSHYDSKTKSIYVFDELYERGLTNDVLADEVKKRIAGERVICDSAEPKSIAELQHLGVNAEPAEKGKDSIVFGIQWLQQQTIIIDSRCINTINEFRSYKWREDSSGNALRVPVDRDNHIIDAMRYAYEEESAGENVTDDELREYELASKIPGIHVYGQLPLMPDAVPSSDTPGAPIFSGGLDAELAWYANRTDTIIAERKGGGPPGVQVPLPLDSGGVHGL